MAIKKEGWLARLLHVVEDRKFAVYHYIELADEVLEKFGLVLFDDFLRLLLDVCASSGRRRLRLLW